MDDDSYRYHFYRRCVDKNKQQISSSDRESLLINGIDFSNELHRAIMNKDTVFLRFYHMLNKDRDTILMSKSMITFDDIDKVPYLNREIKKFYSDIFGIVPLSWDFPDNLVIDPVKYYLLDRKLFRENIDCCSIIGGILLDLLIEKRDIDTMYYFRNVKMTRKSLRDPEFLEECLKKDNIVCKVKIYPGLPSSCLDKIKENPRKEILSSLELIDLCYLAPINYQLNDRQLVEINELHPDQIKKLSPMIDPNRVQNNVAKCLIIDEKIKAGEVFRLKRKHPWYEEKPVMKKCGESSCGICFEICNTKVSCGHTYHLCCLYRWTSNNCPLCIRELESTVKKIENE